MGNDQDNSSSIMLQNASTYIVRTVGIDILGL